MKIKLNCEMFEQRDQPSVFIPGELVNGVVAIEDKSAPVNFSGPVPVEGWMGPSQTITLGFFDGNIPLYVESFSVAPTPDNQTDGDFSATVLLTADNQGQRPPIDWTKGKKGNTDVKPFGPDGPSGTMYEIEIGKGDDGKPIFIKYWVADDGKTYWCHGLTFGGDPANGVPPSLGGKEIDKIIGQYYDIITDNTKIKNGDVIVFRDSSGVVHSVIIKKIVLKPGTNDIDYDKTEVITKDGITALRETTLRDVFDTYEKYSKFLKHNGFKFDLYTRK